MAFVGKPVKGVDYEMKTAEPDQKAAEALQTDNELPPFFYLKDLVGRHSVFFPKEILVEDDPFNPGKQQEKIIADVLVLDGRKTRSTDERNVFPKLPRFQRSVWLRGVHVVAELKPFLPESGDKRAGLACLAHVGMKDKAYWLYDADPDMAKAVDEGQYDEFVEADPEAAQGEEPPF